MESFTFNALKVDNDIAYKSFLDFGYISSTEMIGITNYESLMKSYVGISCFVHGTLIKCVNGWINVESLKIGDIICCTDGVDRKIVKYGKHILLTKNKVYESKGLCILQGHSILGCVDDVKSSYDIKNYTDGLLIDNYLKIMPKDHVDFKIKHISLPTHYYHFCLESDNIHAQYGVYSGAYMTESMSISYFNKSNLC